MARTSFRSLQISSLIGQGNVADFVGKLRQTYQQLDIPDIREVHLIPMVREQCWSGKQHLSVQQLPDEEILKWLNEQGVFDPVGPAAPAAVSDGWNDHPMDP